jgi:hypothetical protein
MKNPEYQQATDLLTRRQAAAYLSISTGTLDKLDIPFVQIRRRIIYRQADIVKWLENHTVIGEAV